MDCSGCNDPLDEGVTFCPSCGYDVARDYVISCMDELNLCLCGHPNWNEEEQTVSSEWFDERRKSWKELGEYIILNDQQLKEQLHSNEPPLEHPIAWLELTLLNGLNSPIVQGTASATVSNMCANAGREIDEGSWLSYETIDRLVEEKKILNETILSLEEQVKSAHSDTSSEESSFSFVDVTDWLMAKPISLAFVLIGFLCFFVSFTAMAVVTSQKCALGSPLVVEIQEQCSEAADLVNMMVWLGMGMVLIGWLLKK